MAHFVAFCIGFQKNIPLQNPLGEGGGYMAAQGLLHVYQINISHTSPCSNMNHMINLLHVF